MSEHPKNLSALLERSERLFGDQKAFGIRSRGRWQWVTYRSFAQRVRRVRAGLHDLGIGKGDRVALVSNNRVEWAEIAYACFGLGAALVPMYDEQSQADREFVVSDSGARVLICATRTSYNACANFVGPDTALQHRVGIDLPASDPASYERLVVRGEPRSEPRVDPAPDDIACLLYTSGTTGQPKGVVLTHENICSNIRALVQVMPITGDDRSLSFLPWAHAFGQTCELHVMLHLGATIAICDSVAKLARHLREVKPTVLVGVPRVFNGIFEAVGKQVKRRPTLIRELFARGLKLADKQRTENLNFVERLALEAVDRSVFAQIRHRFGGRLKYAFSGGAALSLEVGKFLHDLGIVVYEGYGLTETGPVITTNCPAQNRLGSVGKPLPGVRIRLDESASGVAGQGEIIAYGPNVMTGYHQRPEATAAVFTDDGGLRTGDLGTIDHDGFLFITGRIKEQYKLENGKEVVPAKLERAIRLSSYISNVMVHGANRPFNVALVVADIDALSRWAGERDLTFSSTADMLRSDRVLRHLMAEIGERSHGFRPYERIKRLAIIGRDFTAEGGLITPTMKLKRTAVLERYASEIAALYEGERR